MLLKEFIHNLNKLIENDESWGEMEVLTSIDDEGNGYNPVYFHPTVGHWENHEFKTEADLEEDDERREDGKWFNAVCVN